MGDSDHGWGEIEQFIADLAELAQSDIAFGEFAGELLKRTTGLLAAAGGAVWIRQPQDELFLQCEINWKLLDASGSSAIASDHAQFLHSIIQADEGQLSPPRSFAQPREAGNSSQYLWIAAPFRVDGEVIGLVEVLQQPAINLTTQQGNVKLLAMVCELTGDFIRRQQLRQLRQAATRWQHYESMVERVLSSLELRQTAFQLVNEGRSFIGCDRVSLMVPRRGDLRVLAISGVDTFDPRSFSVRSMETLAKLVVQAGRPLRYPDERHQVPPQLEKPLAEYLDVSHAQSLELVPLQLPVAPTSSQSGELVGVLVVEQFNTSSASLNATQVHRVANLSCVALRNALEYDTLPLRSVANLVRKASSIGPRQRSKMTAVLGGLVVVGLALALIPARLYVRAEGELQPAERREIYAPLDGEVVEVHGEHDEDVEPGQVLLVLRSRSLEIELQRLQGEYQTTEKRLFAVASARFQSNADTSASDNYPGELAAEEQELKQLLLSQQKQIQLVREQFDQLSVQSPIQGRVLTWNTRELLEDRPVQKGQLLMSTAKLQGPWIIELSIPENRAGHLLAAQRAHKTPLEVTFALASDRSTTYRGQIEQVGARTEIWGGQQPSVKVTATVPDTANDLLRPGAIIYAKVDCGIRSLGFVWLHDLVETIWARVLL